MEIVFGERLKMFYKKLQFTLGSYIIDTEVSRADSKEYPLDEEIIGYYWSYKIINKDRIEIHEGDLFVEDEKEIDPRDIMLDWISSLTKLTVHGEYKTHEI